MTVPVFKGSQIVAVVGVANKATDYTQTDVLQLSLLTDSVWKLAERKETEEALRRSEERFRVALKNSGIVVAATDADLRYTWIHNPHPAFDPAGTIGKRDDELVEPENAKGIMDIKREVLATGKGVRREFMITRPTARIGTITRRTLERRLRPSDWHDDGGHRNYRAQTGK